MIIVDSSGWIEYFTNGPMAGTYEKYLENLQELCTPTIVFFEIFKFIKREKGEETALIAAGQIMKTEIIALDENLALYAAEISLKHSLPMADAIIYATALHKGCTLVTSDKHFEDLRDVIFLDK
jgi:toxin FitB